MTRSSASGWLLQPAPPGQAARILSRRAALPTAPVGVPSGEYRHGRLALFTLFAVAAPAAPLPRGDVPPARPRPVTDTAPTVFGLGAPQSPKPGLRLSDDRPRRTPQAVPRAASDRS